MHIPLHRVLSSLVTRYLRGYPYKYPKLQRTPKKGLLKSDADKLLSLINDQVLVDQCLLFLI
jgi:hypothetical protein